MTNMTTKKQILVFKNISEQNKKDKKNEKINKHTTPSTTHLFTFSPNISSTFSTLGLITAKQYGWFGFFL